MGQHKVVEYNRLNTEIYRCTFCVYIHICKLHRQEYVPKHINSHFFTKIIKINNSIFESGQNF